MMASPLSRETYVVLVYKLQDLLLRSAIEETCTISGIQIAYANSNNELEALLEGSKRDGTKVLVICNLLMNASDLQYLVGTAKNFQNKILGFYPHVDKETESRAIAAGVDFVVPRSAFKTKLRILISPSSRKTVKLLPN